LEDSNAQIKDKQQQTEDALGREKETSEKLSAALGREKAAGDKLLGALKSVRQSAYFNGINLAYDEWLANNVGRTERVLDECAEEFRDWEWHYLKRLCHTEEVSFRGHRGPVTGIDFSPDGSRVASCSWDSAKIWDAETGKEICDLGQVSGTRRDDTWPESD